MGIQFTKLEKKKAIRPPGLGMRRSFLSSNGLHVFSITKVEHLIRTLPDGSPLMMTFRTNVVY